FRFNITPDFGDRPDGAVGLFEANINYIGIKPLTFTVGYFHPFVALDDATFPGNTLFLERPSIVNIERSVAAGIERAFPWSKRGYRRAIRIGLSDRPPFRRSAATPPQW